MDSIFANLYPEHGFVCLTVERVRKEKKGCEDNRTSRDPSASTELKNYVMAVAWYSGGGAPIMGHVTNHVAKSLADVFLGPSFLFCK